MGAELLSTSRLRYAVLASALPSLCMSLQLFYVLHAPLAGTNRQWATDAWLLMMAEFFLMHAGVLSVTFSVVRGPFQRTAIIAVLAGFYAVFMFGLWKVSGGSWIVAGAALLLAARLIGAAIGGREFNKESFRLSWISAGLFLLLVAVTTAPAQFPVSAYTPEVLEQLRSASAGGKGLWVREPQRAVGLGAFYFLFLGLYELWRLLRGWLVP